jgi:hypothetical protein
LIADCAVNWRTPRPSVKNSPLLKEFIGAVRTNPNTTIRITGYSDCVGQEKDNSELRLGRARRVYELLQQLLGAGPLWNNLRSRITYIAAPTGQYAADNSTAEGRAKNRGALIEHTRTVSFPSDDVPSRWNPANLPVETPEFIRRILERARDLFQRTDKWDQFGMPIDEARRRRILCLVSQLGQPGIDDSYLTKEAVEQHDAFPAVTVPRYTHAIKRLLPDEYVLRRLPQKTDRDIWRDMIVLDNEIRGGMLFIIELMERRQSAVGQRVRRMRDWVNQQKNNKLSIYQCYRP